MHARMHARSFSPATPLHLHFSPSVFPPPAAFLSFSRPPPTLSGGCRLIGRGLPPTPSSLSSGSGRGRSRKVAQRYTTSLRFGLGWRGGSQETEDASPKSMEGRDVLNVLDSIDVLERLRERSSPSLSRLRRRGRRAERDVHRPRRGIGVESSTTERSGPPTYLLSSATTAARRSHSLLSVHLLCAHESDILARSPIGRRTAASRRVPCRPSRSRYSSPGARDLARATRVT